MEPRYTELIHRKIDGLISDKEEQDLQVYLDKNTGAQVVYEELAKVNEILARVEEVDPPSHLKHNVMQAINLQQSQASTRPERRATRRGLWEFLNVRVGLAFAGGLACGLLMLALLQLPEAAPDNHKVLGSMIAGEWSDFPVIAHSQMTGEGFSGQVEVRGQEGIVVGSFEVTRPGDVDITLLFDTELLSFVGLSKRDEGPIDFQLADKTITIHSQHPNLYFIILKRKSLLATDLTVTYQAEKATVSRVLALDVRK